MTAGMVVAASVPLRAIAHQAPALTAAQRRTLDAALARLIPAEGPGDWSAADVGAGEYIDRLLRGHDIHAGGYRVFDHAPWIKHRFHRFLELTRVKRQGWNAEVARLRDLYRRGLADLDARAGGDFATTVALRQDAILRRLDLEGDPFFAALYDHTMEGTYAHPAYGGNQGGRAWETFAYTGDTHAVRFPGVGPADAAWNRFGGYAPDEMVRPGDGPGWGLPA